MFDYLFVCLFNFQFFLSCWLFFCFHFFSFLLFLSLSNFTFSFHKFTHEHFVSLQILFQLIRSKMLVVLVYRRNESVVVCLPISFSLFVSFQTLKHFINPPRSCVHCPYTHAHFLFTQNFTFYRHFNYEELLLLLSDSHTQTPHTLSRSLIFSIHEFCSFNLNEICLFVFGVRTHACRC